MFVPIYMQENKHSKKDCLDHVWEIEGPEIIYLRQQNWYEIRDEIIEDSYA